MNTDHILFIASGAFHSCKPSDLMAELQVMSFKIMKYVLGGGGNSVVYYLLYYTRFLFKDPLNFCEVYC